MKPRITVVTLGVDDLDRAVSFYRDGLGFPTQGIVGREFEHGAVAFFDLENGLKLALWARDDLAYDTGLVRGPASSTELSLGHYVNDRSDVDSVMVRAAGRICWRMSISNPPIRRQGEYQPWRHHEDHYRYPRKRPDRQGLGRLEQPR